MRYALLPFCLILLFNSAFAQENLKKSLFFATDAYQLTEEAESVLTDLLAELEGIPEFTVQIQAHTDNRGTEAYNRQLADRRGNTIRTFLAARGVLVEKTTLLSYGESDPAFSNEAEEGRAGNRRVDVLVTPIQIESLRDLMSQLGANQKQNFSIDAGKSIKLVGAQGTTIWIEANAFQYPDGRTVSGAIDLTLQEAYQYSDMILAGLSTHSGDRLLETGGMIEVTATANGEPLQLKKETPMMVAMPTGDQQEGMQLFTGVQDENGSLQDWAPTGQNFRKEMKAVLEMPEKPLYPRYRSLGSSFTPNLSGEPTEPVRPQEPYLPHEPRRSQVVYHPGFFKRLVMGKEKIQAIEEEMFAKKMSEYQERLQKYQEALPAYEKKLAAFAEVMANYEAEHAAWEASLLDQRKRYEQSAEFQRILAQEKEINEKRVAAYEERLAAWQAVRDQKLSAFETKYEATGNLDAASLNNYFFSVNRLGWINCDRFYNIPAAEKLRLAFLDKDPVEEEVFVIFKDSNSILRASKTENFYLTQAIPRHSEVIVLGMKVDNGRVLLAQKEDKAGMFPWQSELDYQPATLREMRVALQQLN